MQVGPILCRACAHLSEEANPEVGTPTTCTAFQNGIPGRYIFGGMPHFTTDGNDKGIVFELNPELQEVLDTYLDLHSDVQTP